MNQRPRHSCSTPPVPHVHNALAHRRHATLRVERDLGDVELVLKRPIRLGKCPQLPDAHDAGTRDGREYISARSEGYAGNRSLMDEWGSQEVACSEGIHMSGVAVG